MYKLFEPLNPNISMYIHYAFPVAAVLMKMQQKRATCFLFCNIAAQRCTSN